MKTHYSDKINGQKCAQAPQEGVAPNFWPQKRNAMTRYSMPLRPCIDALITAPPPSILVNTRRQGGAKDLIAVSSGWNHPVEGNLQVNPVLSKLKMLRIQI